MAKYDIYKNPNGPGYLIELQSELLSSLNTTVVAPLLPKSEAPQPANRLNPVFNIQDEQVVMASQFLAAVPLAELGDAIGHLDAAEAEISSALDMLFIGF